MTVQLKHLTISRPLAVIDLESTGLDPANDRIVEIAMLTMSPHSPTQVFHTRVNPGQPIPTVATAIHGIGDADVAGAPAFQSIAADLADRLDGCDLAGFGISRFDLLLLTAEFARVGVPFQLAGRAVLDALTVFRQYEPRSLTAAVMFYLGRDHLGAHSALRDASAAIAVLDEQVGRYGLPVTPDGLHTTMIDVDVAGKFRRTDDGIVFAFGKYAGRLLRDIASLDPGYLEWMLSKPFLDDVHSLVRNALAIRDGLR